MASYMSQPRQFTPYTPQVNEELYGKLLMQKEQNYQLGVQRIDNQLDTIASLPIANTAARQLAKQKLDAVTTEINQNLGTDWSDRGVQRLTGKHISAIADDPTIQTAVGQTVFVKKDYGTAKQSYEDNDGADIANQWSFNNSYQNYVNNPDPNAKYDGKFTPYVNVDKWGYDIVAKIKPDWRKIDYPADPSKGPVYQQWSKTTASYEEVPEYEVKNILETSIRNNPNVADQLHVNAQYAMKDYTAPQYIQHRAQVSQQQIDNNNKYAEYLTGVQNGLNPLPSDMVGMSDEQVKNYVNQKHQEFQSQNQQIVQKLGANLLEASQDFDGLKDKLYKDSYIDEMVARVSGRKKYSYELTGDPYDRLMKQREYELSLKKEGREASHQKFEEGREGKGDEFDRYKFGIEHPESSGSNLSTGPADSAGLNNAWDIMGSTYNDVNTKNINDINHFLYYNLGNNDLVKSLFAVNKGIVTAKDQVKANALMNDFYTAVFNGKPKADHTIDATIGGKQVNIPEAVIRQVSDIGQNTRYGKLLYDNIQTAHKDFSQSGDNLITPLINALPAKLPAINHTYGTNIKTADVNDFIDHAGSSKSLVKDLSLLETNGYRPDISYWEGSTNLNDIYKKYGNGDADKGKALIDKYYTMYGIKDIKDIVNPNQEILNKRSEFYNERAKDLGFTDVPVYKDLTTGVAKTDPVVRSRISGLQDVKDAQKGDDGKIITDALALTDADKDHDVSKGYKIQASIQNDQHYLVFSDKHGNSKKVAINDPSVINEFFGDIPRPYKTFFNGIVSSNPYKSSYTNGVPNWKESTLVARDPKTGVEIKKGLTWNPQTKSYVMHTYKGTSLADAKDILQVEQTDDLDHLARLIDEERRQNGIIQ